MLMANSLFYLVRAWFEGYWHQRGSAVYANKNSGTQAVTVECSPLVCESLGVGGG